jgi:sec-independent protein translocase protein TatA
MPFDGAFSPIHILIVLVVALLVLGPEELPKVARQVGRGLKEFRRVQLHLRTELRDVVNDFDSPSSTPRPLLPPAESPTEAE